MYRIRLAILGVAVVAISGCTGSNTPESSTTASFRPSASVPELMLSVVDPVADTIWESVATIVTHDGVEERRPRTAEDWETLRLEAVRLVESTNLLLMHDREIARPGFRSAQADFTYPPATP